MRIAFASFLVVFTLFAESSPADDGDIPMEVELMRRLDIMQVQRETDAIQKTADAAPHPRARSSARPTACPAGTTLKWSYTKQLHARFGSLFAAIQYEPTVCHQDEYSAGTCPPSGSAAWRRYPLELAKSGYFALAKSGYFHFLSRDRLASKVRHGWEL